MNNSSWFKINASLFYALHPKASKLDKSWGCLSEEICKQKNNQEGTNDKQKVMPPLKMSTAAPSHRHLQQDRNF